MDQLMDYIYHHSKGVSLDQLLPTIHVVEQHIRRAYHATYQVVIWLHPRKPIVLKRTCMFADNSRHDINYCIIHDSLQLQEIQQ